jgi:hypothetical protein
VTDGLRLLGIAGARSSGASVVSRPVEDSVQVFDGGSSGTAGAADATLFEDEGVFVP